MKQFAILSIFLALSVAAKLDVHRVDLEVPTDPAVGKFHDDQVTKARESRISGGWTASNTQFPFVAELSISTGSGGALCTGSLISATWILSASHCISMGGVQSLRAYLGSADRQASRYSAWSDSFVYLMTNGEWYPDIALFRLSASVPLSSTIQPVRVPSSSQSHFRFEGYTITAAGWGGDGYGLPRFLQYTNFVVLSQSVCNLDSDRGSYSMCSQSQIGSSLEGGDSGGPSVIYESGIPTIVGVNVWVVTSGNNKWQGSMRVSSFLDFIRETTGVYRN
jgi:trypsin